MRSSSSSTAQLKRERLHLRLDTRLLSDARVIREDRGVTMTSLVEEGLRHVIRQYKAEQEARADARPVVDAEQV
jgi:hypothetical protein